jgi:Reverse transcriptase (RNA-dependent DNA polymerase)
VCKILESIIKDEMMAHLKQYNLIKESQYGSVQKRSCLTSLLELLEHVANHAELDQMFPIDVIYLDFQKAFDKVPLNRLMLTLRASNGYCVRNI